MSESEKTKLEQGSSDVDRYVAESFNVQAQRMDVVGAAEYISEMITSLDRAGTKVVSVIGGPASGKTRLTQAMIDLLAQRGLVTNTISTDDYNVGDRAWRWQREKDAPLSLKDFDLLNDKVRAIKELDGGSTIQVPEYDAATGLSIGDGEHTWNKTIGRSDVLIVEGDFDAAEGVDLLVFVDAPKEARLKARINRDLVSRGQVDEETVRASFDSRHLHQYIPLTEPAIFKADYLLKIDPTNPEAWAYSVLSRKIS